MTPLSHFITLDEVYTPAVSEFGIYLKVRRETSRKLDSSLGDAKKRKRCREASGSVNRKRLSTYLDAPLFQIVTRFPDGLKLAKKPSCASEESLFLFSIRPMPHSFPRPLRPPSSTRSTDRLLH